MNIVQAISGWKTKWWLSNGCNRTSADLAAIQKGNKKYCLQKMPLLKFNDFFLNSVTIFGGSAGGASVTYLMASPLAEGLFSKGIAQSGTNLAPWSQPAHKGVAVERATQLAKQFDCYMPNDWPKTINCLRDIPATNITAAFSDFFVSANNLFI